MPAPALLGRYVAIGTLCGVLYVVVDQRIDAHMLLGGQLTPRVDHLHSFLDLVLPVVAGALFGVSLHYLKLRAARARGEARRADELHARLTRVERDQAVWVVVAATLHEIKNPLHAVGLLLGEVRELGADEQASRSDLLRRMTQQLERVQRHVDALRSLSTRSPPAPRRVDLTEVVREVARDLLGTPRFQRAEVDVRGGDAAFVRADPAHLRIILENLLGNALEAVEGQPRSRVDVAIEPAGERLVLRVTDSGPGVPEALRADLFEPLASSKSRGLGLGLSIARALARAMGGDIALSEHAQPASQFVLSLPRSEA